MDFNKRDENGAKAWKDIWGAGQGVGSIDSVLPARDVVMAIDREYAETRARLCAANA